MRVREYRGSGGHPGGAYDTFESRVIELSPGENPNPSSQVVVHDDTPLHDWEAVDRQKEVLPS